MPGMAGPQHLQLGDGHAVPAASGAVPGHEEAGLRASTAAPLGAGTPRFLSPAVSQALPSTNRKPQHVGPVPTLGERGPPAIPSPVTAGAAQGQREAQSDEGSLDSKRRLGRTWDGLDVGQQRDGMSTGGTQVGAGQAAPSAMKHPVRAELPEGIGAACTRLPKVGRNRSPRNGHRRFSFGGGQAVPAAAWCRAELCAELPTARRQRCPEPCRGRRDGGE